MVLNKRIIQEEVELTLELGKYTEKLGECILLFADVSAHKRGLNFRYTTFEVDFILKPRIVDMLLLKLWKYRKEEASAYTFFSLITSNAIQDAINDIRRAERGEFNNVYYIDDVKAEIAVMYSDESEYVYNEMYIENGIIKLN